MIVHLKIIAWLHIIGSIGIGIMLLLMYAFYSYNLKVSPDSLDYAPVTEFVGMSWFDMLGWFWIIISGLVFGLGILRYKEWARLLGLFIVLTSFLQFIYATAIYGFEPADILSMSIAVAFNVYMCWVLLSKTVRDRCHGILANGDIGKSRFEN